MMLTEFPTEFAVATQWPSDEAAIATGHFPTPTVELTDTGVAVVLRTLTTALVGHEEVLPALATYAVLPFGENATASGPAATVTVALVPAAGSLIAFAMKSTATATIVRKTIGSLRASACLVPPHLDSCRILYRPYWRGWQRALMSH
jgi:hypothetical protein